MKISLAHPGRAALLVAAAGLLNFVPVTLAGDVRLFLGGFLYMPLVLVLPAPWAILTAAISLAPTIHVLGHPFALLIMIAEAGWLAASKSRWRGTPLVLDLLFWLLPGPALAAWLYWHLTSMPMDLVLAIVSKQALSGIAAVALARFMLRNTALGRWLDDTPMPRRRMRDIVFQSAFVLAFVPLVVAAVGVAVLLRAYCEREDREVLLETGERYSQQLDLFLEDHRAAITGVARLLSRKVGEPGILLDELRQAHPALVSLVMADKAGRVTRGAPEGLSASIAEELYFAAARDRDGVFVSPAFRDPGIGRNVLMVVAAPVHDAEGNFTGLVAGSIDVQRFLESVVARRGQDDVDLIFLDAVGRVIFAEEDVGISALSLLSHHPQGELLSKHSEDRAVHFIQADGQGRGARFTAWLGREPLSGLMVVAQRPLLAGLEGTGWLYALFGIAATVILGSAWVVTRYAQRNMSEPLEHFVRHTTRQAALRTVEPIEERFGAAPFEIWMMFHAFNGLALQTRHSHVLLQEANAELEKTNRELDQRVSLRTAEAEAARAQAEAASRSKSDFLAMTSHEIRTPLNAIIGLADSLARSHANDATAKKLQLIHRSGNRLMNVVNDLLDLSRIEAGKLALEVQAGEMGAICGEIEALFREQADERGLHLAQEMDPPGPLWVNVDASRLQQVLINLVGNALKFTRKGSVRLCVAAAPGGDGRVELRFAILDTGPGIAPEQQAKLFQPYVQLPGATAMRQASSGLGLSISRRLVDLMGGTLELHSRVGVGSMFSFSLVVPSATPPEAVGEASPAASADRPPLRVLVADDNPANQEVLRALLEKECSSLIVVDSGGDALAEFERGHFDVALIDLEMPGMDGAAVAQALCRSDRGRAGQSTCRLVACSAHARSEVWSRCEKAGFDDYLEKPIDREKLLRLLDARNAAAIAAS